ncbi:MAG: hypothetical protein SAL70_25960 [Scytonema sp. PMC 1070.18]|nr:hypothetical protein [Scytonema sp. PMC 1070.18]MEC4884737.1 hypothetical protein [Scytonema sp. PMC 1070.18]
MGNEVELLEHWRELALEKQRKVLDPRSDRRFGCAVYIAMPTAI